MDDVVLQWFWEIVESYDDTKRAALLQFVTGSNRVPLGGFSKLAGPLSLTPFSISKAPNSDQLPTATTWFASLFFNECLVNQFLLVSIYLSSQNTSQKRN